jgi:hypothetical protein
MTRDIHKIVTAEATTRYTPGHLLAPFGWAAEAVGAMVEAEPTLLFHLFELDRARMHLIALALAHLNDFSPDIGIFLVSGSVRAVTERILGRRPTGIKRALGNLSSRVMPPENYRRLVELLANPDTAKLLHHARSIDSSKIRALHGLPAPLHDGSLAFASPNHACRNLVSAFPQRSPPSLLTTAACGGLRSTPDCRSRRAILHLSYSYASPCGPALLVTQDTYATRAA